MKSTPILLALLILLQGCSVYKGSLTLEEAISTQKQVKVTTSEYPKPIQFKRIEAVDGQYVGVPKRYSSSEAMILQEDKITEIKEHDKTASTIISFTPLAIILALGIVLFADGDGGN
ncbi:MAG: hypothetical protein HKN54_07700 [Flavobacteriaceae bacterium]|nr:hypothetical protein [Flavobacteriaceae bacterium]